MQQQLVGSRGEARAGRDSGCSSTAVAETTCKPHEAFRRRRPPGRPSRRLAAAVPRPKGECLVLQFDWSNVSGPSGAFAQRSMAAAPGDDIQQQLATLLGRKSVGQIRKTNTTPPQISVVDVAAAITGKSHDAAAQDFRRMSERYPDVSAKCTDVKFVDSRGRRGQRNTKATDVRGIVEVVMLLPGRVAARVRSEAARILCRWLGGDLAIIDEVCAIRGFQEQLAAQRPEDPRRVFGEAVEASGSSGRVGEQLARMLTTVERRLTAQDEILARIQERLDRDRQLVNLNVRAPKRAAPHQPQIARDLAAFGRPFPVARFLDEKEREDHTWQGARRSFAPAFGTVVQVLKKKRLREDGVQPIFVEQNHRAQLLYTEDDRELMEEAWLLTKAHREDLAGRPGNPQEDALVGQKRQTVMDMLRVRE